jgi:hypothetical protein
VGGEEGFYLLRRFDAKTGRLACDLGVEGDGGALDGISFTTDGIQ